MLKQIVILLIILFIKSSPIIGQTINEIDVLIGSPEAAEFAKYGNLDVNMFKGVPNIKIPIYNLELKDFSLPIYLSYDAGGIRVDQLATYTGLGWSVHAGGQISSLVNIQNDARNPRDFPEDYATFNPNLWEPSMGSGKERDDYLYAWRIFDPVFGSIPKNRKPDIFYFNYLGKSGKFVAKINTIDSPMSEFSSVPFVNHSISFDNFTFKILDEHGNRFTFGEVETTVTIRKNCQGGLEGRHTTPQFLPDSSFTWLLTEIVTINNDTIRFEYDDANDFTYDAQEIQQKYLAPDQNPPDPACPTVTALSYYTCTVEKTVLPKLLSRIEHHRSGQALEFHYSSSSRLDIGSNILESILISRHGIDVSNFTLAHSYFESPGVTDSTYKRLRLNSVKQTGKPPHIFKYNEDIDLPNIGSFGQDIWGYFNGKTDNTTLVPNVPHHNIWDWADRDVDTSKVGGWTMTEIIWPTGGSTVLDMEADPEGGGLRVRTIYDLDGMGNTTATRKFSYERVTYNPPHFEGALNFYVSSETKCGYLTYTASSVQPVSTMEGPDYGYTTVTVDYDIDGELGRSVLNFSKNVGDLWDTSFTNIGVLHWGRGELLSEKHYRYTGAAFVPVKKMKNTFIVNYNNPPSLGFDTQLPDPQFPKEEYVYSLKIGLNYPEYTGQEIFGPEIPANFHVDKQRIISAWYHPDTTHIFVYNPDDPDQVMHTYTHQEYDTSSTLLRCVTEVNSNGEKRITRYKYAYEKEEKYPNFNKPSKLYSVQVSDGTDVLTKRWSTWSDTLGSGRWEVHKIIENNESDRTTATTIQEILNYDQYGNVLQLKDGNRNLIQYSYDEMCDLLKSINRNPQGVNLTVEAEYNDKCLITEIIDENGVITSFMYHSELNWLTKVHNNNGETLVEYEYHFSGTEPDWTFNEINPNYIQTTEPSGNLAGDRESRQYFAGLGRLIQIQQGIGGGDAIVQHYFFDGLGRESATTNPIIWNTNLEYKLPSSLVGSNWQPGDALPTNSAIYQYYMSLDTHVPDDAKYAYSQTTYYADPLNRVAEIAAPGHIYQMNAPTKRTIRNEYGTNNLDIEAFLGYEKNQLFRNTTIDENNNRSWTFTDGWGRTIAQVVDFDNNGNVSSEDIFTGFEYDVLDRLVKVHEPKGWGTSAFKREYNYDKLDRLTSENNPDLDASTEYLYDKAGNLRFVRNAEHKKNGIEEVNSKYLDIYNPISSTFEFPKNGILTLEVTFGGLWYDPVFFTIERMDSPERKILRKAFDGYSQTETLNIALQEGVYRYNIEDYTHMVQWQVGITEYSRPFQFTYYKYDALGRVIEVGEYYGSSSAFTPENAENPDWPTSSKQAFVLNYYDAPSGDGEANNLKGRLARSRYLDPNTWLWGDTWYSYDYEGRVTWVKQKIPGLATKQINYSYNRQSQITKIEYQTEPSSDYLVMWYKYDSAGRLWRVYTNRTDNKSTAKLEAEYTYTAEGQLDKKALGGSLDAGAQLVDYYYHIRGWLEGINNPDNLNSTSGFPDNRFAMNIGYDDYSINNTNWDAQYNGNISQIRWKVTPEIGLTDDNPLYNFQYDPASRLTLADFHNSNPQYEFSNQYDVRNISYDKSGNFVTLQRYRNHDEGANVPSDFYEYSYYTNTNRLKNLNGSAYPDYQYDAIGNMNYNQNRSITSIAYDWRNLPFRLIQKHNSSTAYLHEYGYDAEGQRVRKRYFTGATPSSTHYYVRGADGAVIAVYSGGTLLYWNLPGGLGRVHK